MKKLFHISNVYVVGIFQHLLEEDNFSCKLVFHKVFELLSGKPYHYACFVPLFFTFVEHLNQSNGLLQNRLNIFLVTPPNQHNIFLSFVAYWHVFAISWPKQKLAKGCSSCKGAHVTIDDNVVVKLLKLKLSSLTFGITLSINSISKGFTSFIRVAPLCQLCLKQANNYTFWHTMFINEIHNQCKCIKTNPRHLKIEGDGRDISLTIT
jgi:hypothetical protein